LVIRQCAPGRINTKAALAPALKKRAASCPFLGNTTFYANASYQSRFDGGGFAYNGKGRTARQLVIVRLR
jgi:hypothetical protein